jgi:LPS export ABC transporter permease LptG
MWSADILIGICGLVLIVIMTRETKFISFSFITKFFKIFTAKKEIAAHNASHRNLFHKIKDALTYIINLPYKILGRAIGILPTYLIQKFMGWFIGLLLVVFVVFVAVDWVSNLKRFEGSTIITVALFYWYYLPWLAGLIIPIVILLASMSAIGSMVRLNELTAVKAAGISVRRLTLAMVWLGVLLAGLGFYIGEGLLPKANAARRELFETERKQKAEENKTVHTGQQEYRRNFYYFGDANTMYHFDEFRTNPCLARSVWRQSFKDNEVKSRISADAADYKDNRWIFINGVRRIFRHDTVDVFAFDTLKDSVLFVTPQDMVAQIKSPEEMSYWELSNFVDKTRRRGEDVSKWRATLDFKIALPIMNFIVMLLGISISARAGRKGGAVLFGIGLLLIFAYWIISQFAIAFAQNGQIPPLIGAWFGNALFFLIAIPLYRRASL